MEQVVETFLMSGGGDGDSNPPFRWDGGWEDGLCKALIVAVSGGVVH
jgi:hypothetical protein